MARWTLIISSRSATLYMFERAITQVPGSAFMAWAAAVTSKYGRSSGIASFFGWIDLEDRGVELRLDHLHLERVLAAVRQVQAQLAAVEERGRGRQDVPLRRDEDAGAERLGPAIAAGPEQLDQLLVGGSVATLSYGSVARSGGMRRGARRIGEYRSAFIGGDSVVLTRRVRRGSRDLSVDMVSLAGLATNSCRSRRTSSGGP